MTTAKKSKRAWLYLSEEDQQRLQRLVEAVGTLNEAMVLSALASAGLKACEQIGNRMPLPLKFQIAEAPIESTPLTKSRR